MIAQIHQAINPGSNNRSIGTDRRCDAGGDIEGLETVNRIGFVVGQELPTGRHFLARRFQSKKRTSTPIPLNTTGRVNDGKTLLQYGPCYLDPAQFEPT